MSDGGNGSVDDFMLAERDRPEAPCHVCAALTTEIAAAIARYVELRHRGATTGLRRFAVRYMRPRFGIRWSEHALKRHITDCLGETIDARQDDNS